jgi:hypothetical protein
MQNKHQSKLVLGGAVVENSDDYFDDHRIIDFDHINRDLIKSHIITLLHSPTAYL